MSAADVPDLSRPTRVHLVAVGGAGMSAIATVLAEAGHDVSGSDLVEGPALPALRRLGVSVQIGHDVCHVGAAEVLVVSTAVPADNPEVLEALRRGVPVLSRREMLPALGAQQPFLSVSGTHGKTTVSSMLTVALRAVGEDPSFLIGAPVEALGGAAGHHDGRFTVLEADESDGSFLAGPRRGAVLTNVEADHLEFWGGWDELRSAFVEFLEGTDGPTVSCADDPGSLGIAAETGAVLYGTNEAADYRIHEVRSSAGGCEFTLRGPQAAFPVRLQMPGIHNARNAAGAMALVGELGLDLHTAGSALGGHIGVSRRFERRGAKGGVTVVDDYAHLPSEVRAALAAGSALSQRRVVVFQPHRYSRTQALAEDFAGAFGDCDVLVLTDVYPAGEVPRPGVDGRLILDAVKRVMRVHGEGPGELHWAPSLDDAVECLHQVLRAGDLLMTVGAGDVRSVGDRILSSGSPRTPEQSGDDGADAGVLR